MHKIRNMVRKALCTLLACLLLAALFPAWAAGTEEETITITLHYDPKECTVRVYDGNMQEDPESGLFVTGNGKSVTLPKTSWMIFEIYDIKEGYRIKSVFMNDTDRTEGFINGAYGGMGFSGATADIELTAEMEPVPENLPTITKVTVYTDSAGQNPAPENMTFGAEYKGKLYGIAEYSDGIQHPNYYNSGQWQYSTDGVNWYDTRSWGSNRYDFWPGWKYHNTANEIDYLNASYDIRLKAVPRDMYAAGDPVYSNVIHVNGGAAAQPLSVSSVNADKTSANAGEKITWTCTATGGDGDLQYYFILYKDGTKLKTRSYSTKKTYSYTPTEAGTYKVKVYVKDSAGNKVYKTSKGVTVIAAVAAPVITTQPKAQTAAAGATATFKVVASGTGLTYQWQYKTASSNTWKDKSGATKASYTVTAKESYNGIQYRCVVSNAGGSVTSSAAKLTVTAAVSKPEITTQPKAQTAAAGETATFKVVASGTGLTYQWQYSTDYGKTWHDKAGSTKATHTVTVKASYNGYLYRCKVTNSAGTVTSSKVRLTVSGVKPKILSQPAAVSAAAGESVTFKVAAAGVGMSYQWQYKTAGSSTWKDKSGATSASYTVTAKESYNGIQYRCVVTNSVGSVTSDPAVLTVS